MTAPELQKLFDACCEEVEQTPKDGVRSEVVLVITPTMREQLELRRQMRKVKS